MAEYVYGIHAVDSLLRRNPGAIVELALQSGREDRRIQGLLELARNQGVSVVRLPRRELDQLADGRHQGALARLATKAPGAGLAAGGDVLDEAGLLALVEAAAQPVLLLVLDGVTDPHNLGACLRSADAAGAHAVVVPKDKSADLNPTVRKVACGAAESVPFARVTNLARTLEALKRQGVWVYGAAGEADTELYDCQLTDSVALVLGAEGSGLRRLTRECCDHLVKLPMAGSVSSLNVSVAAGVCLFEVVRQRR